jgi:hypothetical protein
MTCTSGISAYHNSLLTHKFWDIPQHCAVLMEITDFAIFLICRYENPYNMNQQDTLFSINLFQ